MPVTDAFRTLVGRPSVASVVSNEAVLERAYQRVLDGQASQIAADKYAVIKSDRAEYREVVALLISQVVMLYRQGAEVKLHPQGFFQLNVTDKTRWETSGGLRL